MGRYATRIGLRASKGSERQRPGSEVRTLTDLAIGKGFFLSNGCSIENGVVNKNKNVTKRKKGPRVSHSNGDLIVLRP